MQLEIAMHKSAECLRNKNNILTNCLCGKDICVYRKAKSALRPSLLPPGAFPGTAGGRSFWKKWRLRVNFLPEFPRQERRVDRRAASALRSAAPLALLPQKQRDTVGNAMVKSEQVRQITNSVHSDLIILSSLPVRGDFFICL